MSENVDAANTGRSPSTMALPRSAWERENVKKIMIGYLHQSFVNTVMGTYLHLVPVKVR